MIRDDMLHLLFVVCLLCAVWTIPAQAQDAYSIYADGLKPRVIVLTDIFTIREADDTESMVRLLAYADVLEIEGLIATGGYNLESDPNEEELWAMVMFYGEDAENLMRRSGQTEFLPLEQEQQAQQMGYWPSREYLFSVIREGQFLGGPKRGMEGIGEGKDTEGSDFIIQVVDEPDPRPVYVVVWGGANTLGQALIRVRSERSERELADFISKIRVHSVIDQDNSGEWIREEFPDLFWLWEDYYASAYKQRDEDFLAFAREHYNHHGTLGDKYVLPPAWVTEGDTPSFAGLLNPGLSDYFHHPEWGGWSGRFTGTDGRKEQMASADSDGLHPVLRWFEPFLTDLAARMDWAESGTGNRNPAAVLNGDTSYAILPIQTNAGDTVTLSASGSSDPDGDTLRYRWWVYDDAGTYRSNVELSNSDTEQVTLDVPGDAAGKEIHVILEVWDTGGPALVSYRRAIVRVQS